MRNYINPTGYAIVGTTFHLSFDQMKFLPTLKNNYNLILKVARDKHNHYDKNAINVYMSYTSSPEINSPRQNILLGYLSKETAQQIADQQLEIDPLKSYELDINPTLFKTPDTLDMKGPSDEWFKIGNLINDTQVPEKSSTKPELNPSQGYGRIIDNPFK